MVTTRRARVFIVLAVFATLFVAMGALQASAAAPAIKLGHYQKAAKCSHEPGGENICTFKSDGSPFKFLTISGKHFTPKGEIRVTVWVSGTNHILVDGYLHANSQGNFGIKTKVEVCGTGKKLAVAVIDEDTGILSNVAFVKGC